MQLFILHTLSKISPAMGGPTVIGREKSARRHPGKMEIENGKIIKKKGTYCLASPSWTTQVKCYWA